MCLLLYGSRARGDFDAQSDVDLTAITAGDAPTPVSFGRTTMMAEPLDDALRATRSGSLFAYHLVSEGKVLFESEPVFARIRRAFRFRDDYTPVIRHCSDAGWFLVRHHEKATDASKFNHAVAWCTREMLIAKAATAREPVFSADGLAEFVGYDAVAPVIRSKRSAVIDPEVVRQFRHILGEFGTPAPAPLDLSGAGHRFRKDRNSAGVIAVRAFRDPVSTNIKGGEHVSTR
ncbi:hypothetical protein A5724_08960 [Mycobacterium sp. ACS1612]|uniref:nucleotidyltransferase domain-containing protein n=1 Tax=Mycobacterium sp. ACS1612 TaxID=1834117 RepID=UPI0007FBB6C4|nr:nucleotidyltransferase domain-containing protein [Mycobacterium sp. ACS1612]OBF38918.1 hypothetical protein A5724_08960 [Mycobacterium sp. ACS1612]